MEEITPTELQPIEQAITAPMQTVPASPLTNILDSVESFKSTMQMAKTLSMSSILPRTFSGNPSNCVILIDMVKRSGMSLLFVAQNLYIVSGNPSWSGQACIALINNCGRFTPIKFKEVYKDEKTWSCQAYATEKATGETVYGTVVDYNLVKAAGWLDKSGSYWAKMPMQMAKYRAAAFFARSYCPEALFGLYTDDEQRDIHGYEKQKKEFTLGE